MMQIIPLRQEPNQKLQVQINQQNIEIILYTINNILFCDLIIDSVIYDTGIKCNQGVYLNKYYNNLKGYLFFWDILDAEPIYSNFGTTCTLYFSETDVLKDYFYNWLEQNV